MADTHDFAVTSEKSTPRSTAYRNDPFTLQNGHYIGHDGFIVPNSFTEFYQRFPTYVADWVGRRVRDCASATEAEDWTQELLLHLAVLPSTSKFRRDGKQDVIQTFVPTKMHGANEARFRSFINQCLSNKFNTLYVKWRKRPLSNPKNLSLEVEYENGANDEYCHANSTFLRMRERRVREREEQRLRLAEFVRLAQPHVPNLRQFIGAFRKTGNWKETENLLGRNQCESSRRSVRQVAMGMG